MLGNVSNSSIKSTVPKINLTASKKSKNDDKVLYQGLKERKMRPGDKFADSAQLS